MTTALAKLLTLLAVLLMPLGMAAPASASAHHPANMTTAAMPMPHCPDQGSTHHAAGAECTMACAATLPALSEGSEPRLRIAAVPAPRILAAPLPGLHPETATPPPRFS